MRPSIEAPTKYGFSDFVARIPRSVFGFQNVASELARSAIGWRTILLAFAAFILFFVFETLAREWIAPELRDSFRESAGELGYFAFVAIALVVTYALLVGSQWLSLKLVRERASWREITLAFVASSLPQVPLIIAWFAVFAAMRASGVDIRLESTFNLFELALSLAVSGFYLSWALSAMLNISASKSTLAVLFGPIAALGLMLWLSIQAAG